MLLSGGQWQRVALARAFLRGGRDLVILDEPSSGLDAEAEYEIHSGLRAHRHGRTSVLISHRLNAIRDADHIVVLVDGTVAEQGDHHALMARSGTYARLFSLQAKGFADDTAPAHAMSVQQKGPALSEFSVAILILAACVFAASAAAKLHSRAAYRSFRAGLRETALMPERLLPVTASRRFPVPKR